MLPVPLFACPSCSEMPYKEADPQLIANGITSYLREQAFWTPGDLKKLGEYIIAHSNETTVQKKPSIRETMTGYIADVFEIDPSSLPESEVVNSSYSSMLTQSRMVRLAGKLRTHEAKTVSNKLLGERRTEDIVEDNREEGRNEINYQILSRIGMTRGRSFTIGEFLQLLHE